MGWDRATPFTIDLQVGAEDIDGLGHANNAVYVTWLERCALTAGIGTVYLEARCRNLVARAFYRKLGYQEIAIVRGYYQGMEDGVRIARDLWLQAGDPKRGT